MFFKIKKTKSSSLLESMRLNYRNAIPLVVLKWILKGDWMKNPKIPLQSFSFLK